MALHCSNKREGVREAGRTTSASSGHKSLKKTFCPSGVVCSGCCSKSMFTVPAKAYAITSGGLARYVAAVWG